MGIYHCYPSCSGYFSDATSALSKFGYEYSLSKTDNPWSDNYKVVYQSDRQLTNPVSYDFMIGENWKFEVTPENGWENNTLIAVISVFFIAITLLLAVLTRYGWYQKKIKTNFKYWRTQILLQVFTTAMDSMNWQNR